MKSCELVDVMGYIFSEEMWCRGVKIHTQTPERQRDAGWDSWGEMAVNEVEGLTG